MKRIALLLMMFLSVGVLAACGEDSTTAAITQVKVGIIAPMTGDSAAFGPEMERIVSYALPAVNAKLAAKGLEIVPIFEDGKCSGDASINAYQKLTDIDGVQIVIGGICSSETLAIGAIADSKHILTISISSANPKISSFGDYVFSLGYNSEVVGKAMAQELTAHKRVALLTEQTDYNIGMKEMVTMNLEGTDTEIVANEVFPKGEREYRNILQKILQEKPDAIFLNPNIGVTAITLLKQMAEDENWKGVKLYSAYPYFPNDTRADVQEFTEGMIIVDAPALDNPELLTHRSNIEATGGKLIQFSTYFNATTLDTLQILGTLLEEYGTDYDAIRTALRQRTFNGYIGPIYFGTENFNTHLKAQKFVVTDGSPVVVQ